MGNFKYGMVMLLCCFLLGCQEEADPLRLDQTVVPLSQTVILSLNPDAAEYNGSVLIELDVRKTTDSFRFHARQMNLTSVRLGSKELTFDIGTKGTVTATTRMPTPPGHYLLEIEFNNDYNRKGTGIYKVSYEGQNYLFSQMEPEHARESFPCWDAPEFKIPWQITLAVPSTYSALSNTPTQEELLQGNVRQITFAKTKPMPSYLVAVAVGDFEHTDIKGMSVPGKIYTAAGKASMSAEAVRISPMLLKTLEDYFGMLYPYQKLDQLAVPEFNYGAMENAGLITYRDTILLRDAKSMSTGQKQHAASVIAHEMAHMWFGNLVTLKWWDDLWLNESFSSWIGQKTVAQTFPEYGMENRDISSRQSAMNLDALDAAEPIRRSIPASNDMHNLFDELAYNKGMAILGMVENWIGEEPFRQSMIRLMQNNRWKNVDAYDLAKALDASSRNEILSIVKDYVTQPGIPLIQIDHVRGHKYRISQQRYRPYGASKNKTGSWTIPIQLEYSDGNQIYRQPVLLQKQSQTIKLQCNPVWIHPNADEKGYYLWNLSTMDTRTLAIHVSDLDVRKRIGFIHNLSMLFAAGNIDSAEYIRILTFFCMDNSPEVMQAVVQYLTSFYDQMITAELREPYGKYLSTYLNPMLNKIGSEYAAGEDVRIEALRAQLINVLGRIVRDPKILETAEKKTAAFMGNPYEVDASLIRTYLELAAIHGGDELFDRFARRYKEASIPIRRADYLSALSSFRSPELIKKALAYNLTEAIAPHQFGIIPSGICDCDENRWIVLDWMKTNYNAIQAQAPGNTISHLPWLFTGQSQELLANAASFLLNPSRKTQGIEKTVKKAAEHIKKNAALREKELPNIQRFLAD